MNIFVSTLLFLSTYWNLNLAQQYQPNWDSLDTRPLPLWYDEAKFGIFTHWGVYCVPGMGEWFWYNLRDQSNPNFEEFMATHWKPNTTYADLAREFTAVDFNADVFANIVKSSGARYFVLTTKHHEGFTLWPSDVSWNWNAMDIGPRRDLVGEIRDAILRVGGVRWGTYLSMADWFHPIYIQDAVNGTIISDNKKSQNYPNLILYPQWLDLITNYQPDILWSDGDWGNSSYYRSAEFLAWLYNESPVKDTIIVNDRWGSDTHCKHGGFLSCSDRYLPGILQKRKWEDANSIDTGSWGFRRNMNLDGVHDTKLLVSNMVQAWATGGNFLLNIGPDSNGRVIPIFEERLAQIGAFINAHEEAIFGSKPWIFQSDNNLTIWYTSQLRNSAGFDPYRFLNPQTEANTMIYAFVTYWPTDNLIPLAHVIPTSNTIVSVFSTKGFIRVNYTTPSNLNGGIQVDISPIALVKFPANYILGLKIEYAADQKLSCPEGFTQSAINSNKCYKVLSTPLSYNNADTACRNVSDSLISIDNVFENEDIACKNNFKIQIKNLANLAKTSCQSAYIGLQEVGTTWYWTNRDLGAYRNWASNNPSTDPTTTCAVINTSNGKWTNQACSTPQCAVCVYALE